jgi:hypothetical protein
MASSFHITQEKLPHVGLKHNEYNDCSARKYCSIIQQKDIQQFYIDKLKNEKGWTAKICTYPGMDFSDYLVVDDGYVFSLKTFT